MDMPIGCFMFVRLQNTLAGYVCSGRKEEQLQHAVRQLQAEGYHTLAGKLPLEEQLAESWRYQREKDGSGEVRYFVVSAKSKGDSFDAARVQAESLAKVQLAGLMETRIGQLVTNRLETSDGNTVMQTVASSKIWLRLGFPMFILCWRCIESAGMERSKSSS